MSTSLRTPNARLSATRVPPLSQSKFELLACPHLYVSRVILGVEEPPNEYALRGTQVHEGAAHYIDHLVQTRQTADAKWFGENILVRPYLNDAIEILERVAEKLTVDPERVLDTELWLPLDDDFEPVDANPGDPEVVFEGTLDYIELPSRTEAVIEDFKTYWQIVDADTFQSDLYPLLLLKHFTQIERVTFKLNFVRYGVTREKVLTRDDIPRLEKIAREARRRQLELHRSTCKGIELGDGNFSGCAGGKDCPTCEGNGPQAAPGSHCAYCPKLRKGCPIAEINPYTSESVEDRVKFGIWLQAAKKENDRILKDLVCAGGPVQIKDANGNPYVATFLPSVKASFPAVPCVSIVTANDPDLAQKLTVSGLSTPLKAKKRLGLAGLLAPYKVETTQTRFSIRGVEPGEEEGE